MNRREDLLSSARTADVIFQPALTPLEAAMLPAREKPGMGALHHVQASWQLDGPKSPARQPKLTRWGPYRQKI